MMDEEGDAKGREATGPCQGGGMGRRKYFKVACLPGSHLNRPP